MYLATRVDISQNGWTNTWEQARNRSREASEETRDLTNKNEIISLVYCSTNTQLTFDALHCSYFQFVTTFNDNPPNYDRKKQAETYRVKRPSWVILGERPDIFKLLADCHADICQKCYSPTVLDNLKIQYALQLTIDTNIRPSHDLPFYPPTK